MFWIAAWVSIGVATASAILIAIDERRRPQPMAVMNVVWPVTALYASALALWAYRRFARASSADAGGHGHTGMHHDGHVRSGNAHGEWPAPKQIALSTMHCSTGCMIADLLCEFMIAGLGLTLLGSVLWAEFAIDLAAAWALGIVFQYLAIQPMRHLPPRQALAAAIKADTLSIIAFQFGMYGWMALTYFVWFPAPHLNAFQPQYWLMMQGAMLCGFATSYPMNAWLMRAGIKEAM